MTAQSQVPSLTAEEYLSRKGKLAEKCGGNFWGVEKKNAPGFDKPRYYFNCVSYPASATSKRGGMVDIYWDQNEDKMCLKNGGSGPELDAAVAVINEKVKKIVKPEAFPRWCFK